MIDGSFLHCHGIGPKNEAKLKECGLHTWDDCLQKRHLLPFKGEKLRQFIASIQKSKQALNSNNIAYFTRYFPTKEHWRILAHYFEKAVFFDIETTDISWHYGHASVIVALHNNKLTKFVYDDNLDEFLQMVETAELLVSFNGNSFDIPFLEHTFHIPEIRCPHIDLRWVAYHAGYKGGLKTIEKQFVIQRPTDIMDIDGNEAIRLFYEWQDGDEIARQRLLKYCAADVVTTYMVACELLSNYGTGTYTYDKEKIFSLISS